MVVREISSNHLSVFTFSVIMYFAKAMILETLDKQTKYRLAGKEAGKKLLWTSYIVMVRGMTGTFHSYRQ